ncbi:EcsC family protein [Peribacillus kribbensis]|uniref:EcsC family protein n=1 Tax=Peribacillus kribbensis TaxID=356658 RepID=UPI00040D7883|nr:EcsC family protein [Peribacillus kribbensis]
MDSYETRITGDVMRWKMAMETRSSIFKRLSKRAQAKLNSYIPEKAHKLITDSVKGMVKAALAGADWITRDKQVENLNLEEKEQLVKEAIAAYRKAAAIEGAGTGAAGFIAGLADFPLLLAIKMKFLFELTSLYGFDAEEYEERLFILHVFQLAFSSDDKRAETLRKIENWDQYKNGLKEMDWRVFQQEYRDYIDLAKMLQLVPGIGAVVGAYANYNLLDHLGETAMNCWRMRILKL